MQYELECGHCGYQFALVAPLPRSVQCGVCGGALTLAIAVPVAPPVAPPAPPSPPPPPRTKPLPPPPPVVDEEDEDEPEERTLAEPWPGIRNWFNAARVAADIGCALLVLVVCLDLYVMPVVSATRESTVLRFLMLAGMAIAVAAFPQSSAAFAITRVPRTHGRKWMHASVALLGLSLAAGALAHRIATVVGSTDSSAAAVAGTTVVLFVGTAFIVWLTFLARLGRGLGDEDLVCTAVSMRAESLAVLAITAIFLTGAVVAERVGVATTAWLARGAAGVGWIVSLRQYAAILRVVVATIDRRAPAAP